ncbi:unnamed protein product [Malus baccata var. baccata]
MRVRRQSRARPRKHSAQVTIYFHGLPAIESKLGRGRCASHRISFPIDQAPTICNMVKTKVVTKTCKVPIKVIKVGPKKCPPKTPSRNARKIAARAFRKKIPRERLLENIKIVSMEFL